MRRNESQRAKIQNYLPKKRPQEPWLEAWESQTKAGLGMPRNYAQDTQSLGGVLVQSRPRMCLALTKTQHIVIAQTHLLECYTVIHRCSQCVLILNSRLQSWHEAHLLLVLGV